VPNVDLARFAVAAIEERERSNLVDRTGKIRAQAQDHQRVDALALLRVELGLHIDRAAGAVLCGGQDDVQAPPRHLQVVRERAQIRLAALGVAADQPREGQRIALDIQRVQQLLALIRQAIGVGALLAHFGV
jgi:hypothetical protein